MVKDLRLFIIVDNEPGEGFRNSWGFSAYIESDSFNILFDADTDPVVVRYNLDRLGIDLGRTDFIVLSHHHRDHYGGLKYIGRVVPGLKIYIPPGDREYLEEWGLDPVVNYYTSSLMKDVWIIGPLRAGLWGVFEEALAVYVDGYGLVLLVGCSHPGVDNMVFEALDKTGHEIYWVLGGYHSPNYRTLDRLVGIARYVSPAHCSGSGAREYVLRMYPDKYIHIHTGLVVDIPFRG